MKGIQYKVSNLKRGQELYQGPNHKPLVYQLSVLEFSWLWCGMWWSSQVDVLLPVKFGENIIGR